LSDTKILVSGCGITYSKQKIKTWSNILQLTGCTIVDVGGPAVSNQWIINKTLLELQLQPDIKTAVVQLSSLGKLDVYVDQKRIDQLVIKDPLRNFIIDENFEVKTLDQIDTSGVWPSSWSNHHESKKQWYEWLSSPFLAKEDLYCKLILLNDYCQQRNIKLHVYQGYNISWNSQQIIELQNIIKNINSSFWSEYTQSLHYLKHDDNQTSVPGMGYQIEIAQIIAKELPQSIQDKLCKFKSAYDTSQQN
jgi:hypothetical protein